MSEKHWYDGLHQVTRHDRGDLVPSSGPPFTGVDPATRAQQETFAFDQTGNWLAYTAQSPALGQWRAHNDANEITAITGPTGVVQPTYDPVGNMTTFPAPNDWDTAMVATWDAWNRLVSTGVGATVTTYAYDALSRRIQTMAAGVTRDTYYNNQWRAIEERIGGMIAARYVWNPQDRWDLILRERPAATETLYVLKDYLDPVAIINTSGTVVERLGYDAFGPVRFMDGEYSARSTSAHDWNFLFHAEFIDTDSGLYNYGYRYYHPQLGRWLTRDPIGIKGGVNSYAVASNNVVDHIDLFGLAGATTHGLEACEPKDCCPVLLRKAYLLATSIQDRILEMAMSQVNGQGFWPWCGHQYQIAQQMISVANCLKLISEKCLPGLGPKVPDFKDVPRWVPVSPWVPVPPVRPPKPAPKPPVVVPPNPEPVPPFVQPDLPGISTPQSDEGLWVPIGLTMVAIGASICPFDGPALDIVAWPAALGAWAAQ